MTKKDLASQIAERLEISKKDSGEILENILDIITEQMILGNEIKLVGFGSFKSVQKPERKCRNPKTGEEIIVESKKVPKFKFSPSVKNMLNGDK